MTAPITYDVFLSHSSVDRPLVRKLAEQLRSDGLQVWFDEWEIQPGDMIPLKIEQGLQQSRILVLIMSSHAFGSDWVTLERNTMLFRDSTNKQRRFIPVRLDDADIPDTLKQFRYIDWRTNRNVAYKKLFECCRSQANEQQSSSEQCPTIPYFPYLRIVDSDENVSEQDVTKPLPHEKLKGSLTGTKPVIGINIDYRSARKGSSAYCYIHAGYCNSLVAAGAVPMLLPPMIDRADLPRVLDMLDGMLFIGGADLDCRRDGFMLHPSMRIMDHRREEFDRGLMELAAERRMPVMGVGAGMQLLNVSQGGSLSLHVAENLPKSIPHLDAMDPNHRHSLQIEMDTIMERVYGEDEIRVNSMHHQAIDDVAPGFKVTARCPDGVIEAIESTRGDWFAFGTQFHPEHESASCADLHIFDEFIAGIRENGGEWRKGTGSF